MRNTVGRYRTAYICGPLTYMRTLSYDPPRVDHWRELCTLIASAPEHERRRLITRWADNARQQVVEMITAAGVGHIGSDLSVMDILASLYLSVLRIDPSNPQWNDRDRFIHSAGALYVALAFCGFFPIAALDTFVAPLSALSGHPDRRAVPGVETSTGPLGHGLPVAVGAAIAARLQQSQRRVYVVLGDGELQEGSNWEAAMLAGHNELGNLVAIVDRNRLQQGQLTESTNRLEPLVDKFASFAWRVNVVDGHDPLAVASAALDVSLGHPTCLIANTVKGKGVSFMENRVEWHNRVPLRAELEAAMAELAP
jgi:transketolase